MPSSSVGFPNLGIPKGSSRVAVANKTANYTLVNDDLLGGVYVRMNLAGANTVTVPAGLTKTEPVHITQTGLGQTSVVAGGGVTIQSTDNWRKCRTRYSNLTLIQVGTNVYVLIGDFAE